MTPERWAAIEELFVRALEATPEERAAMLRSCDDEDLRREVESLLACNEDSSFLEQPAAWLAAIGTEESVPDRIGAYRILSVLGRGGMGQVFLAEREAPDFRQRVALKIVRRGLDTADVLHRFRVERQILATLSHPNIARVLDVGATDTGVPYFVMEYVEGTSILRYCDEQRLTIAERLRLFRTVCAAVHHAHQSLIVHRDLKPGNILVTTDGVPKLLDFGIAKILDPDTAEPDMTRTGMRLLTPAYAAPEQLRGDPITTAADTYALGVLLYELLAGRHPYADRTPSHAQADAFAPDRQPPPPSAALHGIDAADRDRIADARRTSSLQLRRSVAGDLDTIVLKALRAEPGERYASALSLSEDIARQQAGLPVQARAATLRYQLRKFARRQRVPLTMTVLLFITLVTSSALTLHQSQRVRAEAALVRRERDKAMEVRAFLLEMFGATGPDQPTGETVTVRAVLDRRAATIEEAYRADPETAAELMTVLAESYEKLGLFGEAEPLARRALDTRRALFGTEHPDVVSSLNVLGWQLRELGRTEEAEVLVREAVRVGRIVLPAAGDVRLARALNDLGVIVEARRELAEAAALYRESLDMRRRVQGEAHVGVAITTSNLAVVQYRQGDIPLAAATTREAIALLERTLGADHQRTTVARANLASMLSALGEHQDAADQYRAVVARHRRVLGERHADVGFALSRLAGVVLNGGDAAAAGPLAREALDIQRAALGPAHPRMVFTLRVLGDVAARDKRDDEALDQYHAALAILRTRTEPSEEAGGILLRTARTLTRLGRAPDAERRFRDALAMYTAAVGDKHQLVAETKLSLCELLLQQRRFGDAAPLLTEVEKAIPALGAAGDAFAPRVRAARALLPAAS